MNSSVNYLGDACNTLLIAKDLFACQAVIKNLRVTGETGPSAFDVIDVDDHSITVNSGSPELLLHRTLLITDDQLAINPTIPPNTVGVGCLDSDRVDTGVVATTAQTRAVIVSSNSQASGQHSLVAASDIFQEGEVEYAPVASGAQSAIIASQGGLAGSPNAAVIASRPFVFGLFPFPTQQQNSEATGRDTAVIASEGGLATGDECAVIASQGSDSNSSGTVAGTRSALIGTQVCAIDGEESCIAGSRSSTTTGTSVFIGGSTTCSATGDDCGTIFSGGCHINGIVGGDNGRNSCIISSIGAINEGLRCAIIASDGQNTVTSHIGPNGGSSAIIGTENCELDASESAIMAADECGIETTGGSSFGNDVALVASRNYRVLAPDTVQGQQLFVASTIGNNTPAAPNVQMTGIQNSSLSSTHPTFTSTTLRCASVASSYSAAVTDSFDGPTVPLINASIISSNLCSLKNLNNAAIIACDTQTFDSTVDGQDETLYTCSLRTVGGRQQSGIQTVGSAVALALSDHVAIVNLGIILYAITLPTSPPAGQTYIFRVTATAGATNVTPGGGNLLNVGGTSGVHAFSPNEHLSIIFDGTNTWYDF